MVFHPAQKGFSQSTINVTTAGTITSRKRKSVRSASTPGVMHWSIFANSGTLIVSEDVVVSVCTSFLEGIAALRADDHQPQALHGVFQPGQLTEHYRAQFQQGFGFLGAHFRLHQLRNRLIHRVAELRRHADVALPQHPRIRLINRRLPLLHPGVLLLLHPREILPQFVVLHPRVVKQLRRPARFILHPLANRLLLLSKRFLKFGAPCLCKLGFLRLSFSSNSASSFSFIGLISSSALPARVSSTFLFASSTCRAAFSSDSSCIFAIS